ncbi:sugar phosphate isomerase/epimerase [Brucella sp. BE17]|uniref:sugar phosphate isomerase/epimerase family protein n=1 Tax=Brucella sp. BE17 TaxID=3142977 RepID=UPI0031BA9C5E
MTGYSYQLYSSRNFPPLEGTLTMLRELGYASVEGFGGIYGDPAGLKRELDSRGLSMPTGHFGLDMLENETDRALEIAATLQMTAIFCPYLVAENRPDNVAGWKEFGQRLVNAGKPLRDAGYEFGWHNHDFEFVPLDDGSVPLTHILDASNDLKWEADIAWVIRGGGDPHEWIERYSDRILAVHVKDIAITGEKLGEDGWEDVGHGTVNWPTLFSALRKTPARYFVMEHDNPSDDKRFASRSIAALRNF